ncbi:TRAP transporter substrate-binding protein [Vineibacter terrae]|uniref:TRAP transporter substrate-binding protein n=1 Tax=Vineibacter terrae TaxID=2586908 RepID=A0A5C8PAV0_9HYPH|nr:TRAP transporter substrate-binding protein [Vineibacter terrae]TXL70378.1 TRAP transporter substrate-binding protein [Vineibacter terrae]
MFAFAAALLASAPSCAWAQQSGNAPAPAPSMAETPKEPGGKPDADGRTKLRMQTAFNPGISVLGEASRQFTTAVKTMSAGMVSIKMLEAGAKAPTADLLDAVLNGDVDAAFTSPSYAAAKMPALLVFSSLPFGPTPEEYVAWMIAGEGGRFHHDLYDKLGVHAVMCGVAGSEAGGWFRNEMRSVADLKGLRVRYAGLAGEVLARFGAEIVTLQPGEVFYKLQQGKIDAAEFSMPSVDRALGFDKLSLIYYFPGWHQPASLIDFYMRKDKWEELPPERRALIETACRANVTWTLARAPVEQARAMEYFRKQGVVIRVWPASVMEAFRETSSDVLREQADKDPEFKAVLDDLRQFLDGPRAWKRLVRP